MKRWIGRIFLVLLLIQPLVVWADDSYVPMTMEQADAWLHSIKYEDLQDWVIKWDLIEHSNPTVVIPNMVYLLQGRNLWVYPEDNKPLTLDVGYLSYRIAIKEQKIQNFVPPVKVEGYILVGGLAFVVGLVAGVCVGLQF